MKKMKGYFASRGVGYFLAILTIILAGAAMVLYTEHGINIYASAYNGKVYLCCGLAIAFSAVSLCVDLLPLSFAEELVKPARAIAFLLLLYAIMQYVLTQIMFVGAVVVAIDVDQYSPLIPGFVATFACLLLAAVFAVLGVGLNAWRPWVKGAEVK